MTLSATNSPTSWAVTSGSLPAGLTLNTSGGVISGTPTTAGTFTFSITATNAGGTSAAVSYTITINTKTSNEDIAQENRLKAHIHNGTLYVSGQTVGQPLKVYSITGALIYQSIATGDSTAIPLSAPRGIYIITDNKTTLKTIN